MTAVPASQVKQKDFWNRTRGAYGKDLLKSNKNGLSVNLLTLQRIHIEHLRAEMVSDAFKFRFPETNDVPNGNSLEGSDSEVDVDGVAPRGLREYVQAVQDLQYMREFRTKAYEPKWDPFMVSTDKHLAREVLIERMVDLEKRRGRWKGNDLQDFRKVMRPLREDKLPEPTDESEVSKFGGTRTALDKAGDFQQQMMRVGMATFGGAFLIGPMIIMVLVPGLVASILTTSFCVFGFGLIISYFFNWLQPFEVLSATAAYAAVLVVFVGTSN